MTRPATAKPFAFGLSALALVIVVGATAIGCHGRAKSAAEWSSKKTPFQSGTVLRHAPDVCNGGHLFLDLPRAEKNDATRVAVEVLAGRMVGGVASSTSDRRVFSALRDALRAEGLDPVRDTKELAVCYPGEHAGVIAVFGGDYSGKDIFRAIGSAAEHLGDKPPRVEERHGVEYVRLGRLVIARVSANVMALGDDVALLTSLADDVDRSSRYLYTPDLVAAARIGTEDDGIRVRVADAAQDVSIEISLRTNKTADDLESRRVGVASRVGETPLRGLVPLASNAKISVANGRAKLELRGHATDVANALQTAADLPPNELKRVIAYVFGGADGSGTPEHKI